jgi:hypothetical protein
MYKYNYFVFYTLYFVCILSLTYHLTCLRYFFNKTNDQSCKKKLTTTNNSIYKEYIAGDRSIGSDRQMSCCAFHQPCTTVQSVRTVVAGVGSGPSVDHTVVACMSSYVSIRGARATSRCTEFCSSPARVPRKRIELIWACRSERVGISRENTAGSPRAGN